MGSAVALAARVVLALTLGWAAVAKIRDRREAPGQLRALGVPAAVARPLSVLLPFAEAALAVVLVALRGALWPAWASVLLMGAFTVLVVATMSRGVPCPCFGVSAAPMGVRSVVRNAVLLAVAVLATARVEDVQAGSVVVWVVVLGSIAAAAIVGAGRVRQA